MGAFCKAESTAKAGLPDGPSLSVRIPRGRLPPAPWVEASARTAVACPEGTADGPVLMSLATTSTRALLNWEARCAAASDSGTARDALSADSAEPSTSRAHLPRERGWGGVSIRAAGAVFFRGAVAIRGLL